MKYNVVFTPEAEEQLVTIYRYIANAASPRIAERYTNAIINYCEELATFPHRSVKRDEIRPGLLVTNYKKRTIIAYAVNDNRVSIIGIFYGGQDYQTALESELEE